jgi:hypothetical protein
MCLELGRFGARTRLPVGLVPGHGSWFVERRKKAGKGEAVYRREV